MNHFIRDDELRRSSYLFAARGKASDILTEPTPNQQQPMPAEKLIDLTNNGGYNGKILKPLRIGRASIYCHNKLSFLIQAVSNQKEKRCMTERPLSKRKTKQIGGLSVIIRSTEPELADGDDTGRRAARFG